MSFEWQTEEERDWNGVAETAVPSSSNRRVWWLLGAAILALLLVGGFYLLGRAVTEQVVVATDSVAADLLTSHELVQDAAMAQDTELFVSLLSGRDMDWAAAQEQLVTEGVYLSRPLLGLTWQPVTQTAVISHTLNPTLNAAELVTAPEYSYAVGGGLTATVPLELTAVYRLGPERWLLAPPEPEFWGETGQWEGYFLTTTYPERDEALVRRLHRDLDAAWAQLCAVGSAFVCPADFGADLVFSRDAATLGEEVTARMLDNGRLQFTLPTPTLVGLPQDDAGYAVLLRGYAALVLGAAVQELGGWHCCAHAPYAQAWRDVQLWQMGFAPWPAPDDYGADAPALLAGAALWQSETGVAVEEEAAWLPYLVVRFLQEALRVPAVDLAAGLGQDVTFEQWLLDVTNGRYTLEELEEQWRGWVIGNR